MTEWSATYKHERSWEVPDEHSWRINYRSNFTTTSENRNKNTYRLSLLASVRLSDQRPTNISVHERSPTSTREGSTSAVTSLPLLKTEIQILLVYLFLFQCDQRPTNMSVHERSLTSTHEGSTSAVTSLPLLKTERKILHVYLFLLQCDWVISDLQTWAFMRGQRRALMKDLLAW